MQYNNCNAGTFEKRRRHAPDGAPYGSQDLLEGWGRPGMNPLVALDQTAASHKISLYPTAESMLLCVFQWGTQTPDPSHVVFWEVPGSPPLRWFLKRFSFLSPHHPAKSIYSKNAGRPKDSKTSSIPVEYPILGASSKKKKKSDCEKFFQQKSAHQIAHHPRKPDGCQTHCHFSALSSKQLPPELVETAGAPSWYCHLIDLLVICWIADEMDRMGRDRGPGQKARMGPAHHLEKIKVFFFTKDWWDI